MTGRALTTDDGRTSATGMADSSIREILAECTSKSPSRKCRSAEAITEIMPSYRYRYRYRYHYISLITICFTVLAAF